VPPASGKASRRSSYEAFGVGLDGEDPEVRRRVAEIPVEGEGVLDIRQRVGRFARTAYVDVRGVWAADRIAVIGEVGELLHRRPHDAFELRFELGHALRERERARIRRRERGPEGEHHRSSKNFFIPVSLSAV
jgi:hypothetical protein